MEFVLEGREGPQRSGISLVLFLIASGSQRTIQIEDKNVHFGAETGSLIFYLFLNCIRI